MIRRSLAAAFLGALILPMLTQISVQKLWDTQWRYLAPDGDFPPRSFGLLVMSLLQALVTIPMGALLGGCTDAARTLVSEKRYRQAAIACIVPSLVLGIVCLLLIGVVGSTPMTADFIQAAVAPIVWLSLLSIAGLVLVFQRS